jgi:hypothetical protein
MATKIPLNVRGPISKDPNLGSYMVYNPVLLNFYRYLGGDFIPNTPTLANELAKWGATYGVNRGYVSFEQDEDATLFLLRFS